MNFAAVLGRYESQDIGVPVLAAVQRLLERDIYLLDVNASERSIAARLAHYLQEHFTDRHVDVEYNRMGNAPKRVAWSEDKDDVFPDIIVHTRGPGNNLLAIEIKKDSNPESKDKDICKLRAYRQDENLRYQHALFMRFGVKDGAGTLSECEWIDV